MSFVKGLISARLAGWLLIAGLGLLGMMHVLILAGTLPADFVWGGTATSGSRLYVLEGIALALLLIFAVIVAWRAGIVGTGQPGMSIRVGAWVVFAYLALNILGNLASGVGMERLLFAPATVVLALLALRVAIEPVRPGLYSRVKVPQSEDI